MSYKCNTPCITKQLYFCNTVAFNLFCADLYKFSPTVTVSVFYTGNNKFMQMIVGTDSIRIIQKSVHMVVPRDLYNVLIQFAYTIMVTVSY